MSWCYYVKIPSFKLLIGLSKYVDGDFEYPIIDYDEMYCDVYKPYKDMTINDLGMLIAFYKKIPSVESMDELLIGWLKSRKIPFILIDEFDLDQHKKGYKVIGLP